jgi:Cdc6-like AAA superfamily ATPase
MLVIFLGNQFVLDNDNEILQKRGAYNALEEVLSQWSSHEQLPIVLIIDEIDALIGDTLISLLRQLRSGYSRRPATFLHL